MKKSSGFTKLLGKYAVRYLAVAAAAAVIYGLYRLNVVPQEIIDLLYQFRFFILATPLIGITENIACTASPRMKRSGSGFMHNIDTYAVVVVGFLIAFFMQQKGAMSRTISGQLIPICAYIVMALALNLTVGISGELSLGHAGFMAVGAFTGAVISGWLLAVGVEAEWLRLIIAMAAGGALAAVAGVIIGVPVLRLQGDYLAIVTLAFGEIIKTLVNCLYVAVDGKKLRFSFIDALEQSQESIAAGNEFKMLLNGPQGAVKVAKISTFIAGFVLILFTLFIILNLINSRSGRAVMALRDNRIAAESVGIPITKFKLLAFVISATLAGMAGTLFALNMTTVQPVKFSFDTSILVLVFVVLGGIGNMRGSIIAAALLTILPEVLRVFNLNEYRMFIYAIILIAVMLIANNRKLSLIFDNLKLKLSGGRKKNGGAAA